MLTMSKSAVLARSQRATAVLPPHPLGRRSALSLVTTRVSADSSSSTATKDPVSHWCQFKRLMGLSGPGVEPGNFRLFVLLRWTTKVRNSA